MVYFAGIIIAFFLALILFSKKGKTAADNILAAWLIVIGLHLLLYYLKFSEKNYELPYLLGLELPLTLAHAPFLYWYTASLCGSRFAQAKWAALHFVPLLACYLYLADFFSLEAARKIWVYQNKGAGYERFVIAKTLATFVSGVCYVLFSGLLLYRHTKNIHNLFSYEEKINLKWLQYLIAGGALIWLVVFWGDEQMVFATVVLFVVFVGVFGIRQVGIFTTPPPALPSYPPNRLDHEASPLPVAAAAENISDSDNEPMPTPESDKRKYQKSGLNEVSAAALHQQLTGLMKSQKVFRDSELSLTDLAKRLKTHPNYLSQVINEKEGKNFFDYINTMRVEEFLSMASDPRNRRFTILALALDCGFNSKSSFIRYFKKATGHAPSKYLQSQ